MEIRLVSSRKWVKKIAIPSLLLVSLCLPVTTYALGLGGIKLNSALSEILDADIELVGATEADIEGLKIGLASRDAFLRAGIDRSSVINSVRFAVKKRPNGTYYVKVTSRRAIREPFLNFLMEMNWRNGRMLREYTLLLDPPGNRTQQAQTATVQTPQLESKAAAEAPAPATPFVDVPEAKPAVDPYIADDELFPKRDIKDAAPVADKVAEPEVMRAPEPEVIAPEPEPIVPADVVPEPEVASTPDDTSSGESGAIKPEFKDSGQVNETPFVANAPAEADELFPRIALNPYDPKTKGDLTKPELTAEPVKPEEAASAEGAQPAEAAPESAPEPRLAGEYDYGITSKGDNVWKIAEKLRRDQSITIYQMMMAILQSNPNAFIDGNVHRLKVGQVIRIEDPSILGAISKDAAAQQFIQQTAVWDEYRQKVAGSASTQPIVAGDVGQPGAASASTPQAEIAVEAPDGQNLSATGTSATANNDVAKLQQELQRLSERADAERGKNSALNNRLKEMEAELADMQRSLSVKNDELAALQQQLSQQKNAQPAPAAAATPEVAPTPAPAEPVAEIALPADTQKAPEAAVVEEQPSVVESQEPIVPPVDTTADTKAPDTTTSNGPLEVPVTRQADQTTPAPAPEQSAGFMDGIMKAVGGVFAALTGGALLFVAIPVVVIVLLIIVIMFLRRRRNADNFQESILTGAAPLDEQLDMGSASSGAPASETSSFLSDFAISGVGAIQSDDNEVDPLTEADVFMAYGRYEAAEDRLKDAVNHDPDRKELKVKLLELYNSTKNRAAFEATAEDLYASLNGADNDPNWQKAVALGKQIAPDSPLFSNANVSSRNETTEDILHATSSKEGPDSQVMDIGLDTGVFNTSDFSALDDDAGKQEESSDLDFNFEDQTTGTEDTNDGLDFQLDDAAETPSNKTEENNALDFSFEEPEADNDKMDNDPTMSMTMDNPSMNVDADDENPTMSMTFDTEGLNLDDSSTDLDMDFGDESMELNFDASDAVDTSLNTDADEVSTKLDLARAYIDMGDSEGARSILDEVLAEGNTQQKQEAQQLVTQIG